MQIRKALIPKLKEAFGSVAPVSALVLLAALLPSATLTRAELGAFAVSSVFLIIGVALFNLGADMAMTPMGQYMGEGLTKSKKIPLLFSVCFIMGVLITAAEPDLSVLAVQVAAVINKFTLTAAVGAGVGVFMLLAVFRVLRQKSLSGLLLFSYLLLFALVSLLLERGKDLFLPLALDSGGVTTGPITVPFIMALGVGIALTAGGKNAGENSFGLVSLCSVGAVISVLLLALGTEGELNYELQDYGIEASFGSSFVHMALETLWSVAKSLLPIMAVFAALQVTVLKLPRRKIYQITVGIVYTFVGLCVFLVAATAGFMPVGFRLGTELAAGSTPILIIFSFMVGMVVVLAEPAVHVLNSQVEDITGGGVTRRQMMIALSAGVGASIGLSIVRIIFDFSILYYLIPGYIISLALSFYVPPLYTAIAFDSGGVASGPLTSSFILPFAIGVCAALQGESEVLSLAFGVVAMVAMTPLITIQALGFKAVLTSRVRSNRARKRILSADDAEIIYFE